MNLDRILFLGVLNRSSSDSDSSSLFKSFAGFSTRGRNVRSSDMVWKVSQPLGTVSHLKVFHLKVSHLKVSHLKVSHLKVSHLKV
jgi:hypothetical protein